MENQIEPTEYFKNLKESIHDVKHEDLKNQLDILCENIVLAKKIGQTNFLQKLSFTYVVVVNVDKNVKSYSSPIYAGIDKEFALSFAKLENFTVFEYNKEGQYIEEYKNL